jgi:ribosomal protein L31
VRSTSPAPVHRSTLDSRNHPIWQPSTDSLRNVEKDEAGRLRAFRERFGRGWDVVEDEIEDGGSEGRKREEMKGKEKKTQKKGEEEGGDSLFDLISGAAGGKK